MKIVGEDAGLRLKVPQQCGLRIAGDSYQSYLESMGLTAGANFYQSDGFDTASVKVILDLDPDLRHLSIDYY